jgi:hypothetical protein
VVTLTNAGTSPLTISSVAITGTGAISFLDVSTCGNSLAAGKSCAIYLGFAPEQIGSPSAALSISDNAPGSPQTVSLSGVAKAEPRLSVAPNALAFPPTPVGGASLGQSVTVTNTGTTSISLASIGLGGTDPRDFVTLNNCGATLGSGASCTVFVAFTPKAAGSRSATLNLADDATGSPQTVPLSGTAN